jgi:uncharacterized damage-inducible protein DinB
MSQIDFIVDQLKRAFDGEAWHGPALMEILEGIDAKNAASRPVSAAHSIWELVLHVSAWEQVVTRRIQGEALTLTDEQNFGHVGQVNEKNWRRAIQTLQKNHADLISAVSSLPESRLTERVPGKDYDLLFMLLGTLQHVAYHGGQIALIKRSRF